MAPDFASSGTTFCFFTWLIATCPSRFGKNCQLWTLQSHTLPTQLRAGSSPSSRLPPPTPPPAYVLPAVLITLHGDGLSFGLLFLLDHGLLEDCASQSKGDLYLLDFLLGLLSVVLTAQRAGYLPNTHFPSFLGNKPHYLGHLNA